jgi:hypothetical protein
MINVKHQVGEVQRERVCQGTAEKKEEANAKGKKHWVSES